MRNWSRSSGVYTNMLRVPLFLVCSLAALAQPSFRQDPLDTAIQAGWQARNSGRFEEAAAAREQARALLPRAPVDSPRFPGWVQHVSQLYRNSNWNSQARAILREALDRTRPLGDSHPSRNAVLNALSDSWRQDGNLLKAVGYLEQAAAAQPATPGALYTYSSLARLYRQLGRPDAVAAIAVKIRALASNDQTALAQFYEQQGQLEEAAAIYRKLAEQSADPQARANAWQSLANLDSRQENYSDAVAATQQAIAALQSSDKPWIRDQTSWMRQNLAGYLRQAGQLDQADQVYRQLLRDNPGGQQESEIMTMYAQYLAETKRAPQGESLLKDYLAGHSNLNWQEKSNVLFNLANLAGNTGDSKASDEYRRAAQALLPPPPPPSPPTVQILVGEEMQQAQEAANQHRWDDAYTLALHAIDIAAQAADGQQVQWFVPEIAQQLAANKEPARAERLFQRLLALAQNRKADNMQPLLGATQNYVRFLMSQPDRLSEVPAAIEQYRGVLTDANGPESASLAEPLRLRIEFELAHSRWDAAQGSARDLLQLQESLTGNTSEAYLNDLQTAARVYEAAGDSLRALPLRRQAITIADLHTSNHDWRPAQTRMDVALALAQLGQFDEAVTLGEEAVALQRTMRAPEPPQARQLQQIRQMKLDAALAIATRV
jgi:tetratricopeptide (TPR) repeat protein